MSSRAGLALLVVLGVAAAAWLFLGDGFGRPHDGAPSASEEPDPTSVANGARRAEDGAPPPDDTTPATPTPPAAPEEGSPTDPLVFEGTVIDAKTARPIEGAVVSAAKEDPACRHGRMDLTAAETDPAAEPLPPVDAPPPESVQVTTSSDGTFRLEWKTGIPADVVARKVGYGFGCAAGVSPGRRLVLRAPPGGAIRAMVRRPDGRPVSGALAFLYARGEAGKQGPLVDSGSTDRHGTLELRGVPPGRYSLSVRHGTSMPAALEDLEPSLRSVTVVLAPALRVWLEITSDEAGIPVGTIAVWRLAGQPWREGRVALEPRSGGPRPAATDFAWARVLIPCERSEASLAVHAPGFRPWNSPALVLPPEGGEAEASVRLERDPTVGTLRLSLEDATGKAVGFEDRSVRAVLRAADTGVVVDPVPGTPIEPWVRKGLVPGVYRVDLTSPLHAPASIEFELRAGDDLERRVRVSPPAKVRVHIEAPGKRRVRFRLAREGRAVLAHADDAKAQSPADPDAPTFFADASGVLLTGLGGGDVSVEVLSPDLSADSVSVMLVEGETREVRLTATRR